MLFSTFLIAIYLELIFFFLAQGHHPSKLTITIHSTNRYGKFASHLEILLIYILLSIYLVLVSVFVFVVAI